MKKKFYFNVQIVKGKEGLVKLPFRAKNGDAGSDVFSLENYILKPGERKLFELGFMAEFPENWVCEVRSKSGRALKEGLIVLNQPGTIDCNFRGEYGVILYNAGDENIHINEGEKIAQLVFVKCKTDFKLTLVTELTSSDRGNGGYGSTGKI